MQPTTRLYLGRVVPLARHAERVAQPCWSPAERERAAAYRLQARRDQFLAARWLLRLACAQWAGNQPQDWSFSAPLDGPPEVLTEPNGAPCFSLSHSGDLVACVVGDRPVGVDIEVDKPGRSRQRLAEHVVTSVEQHFVDDFPSAGAVLRHWVLKEAWVKLHRQGIGLRTLAQVHAYPASSPAANAWIWRAGSFALAVVHSSPQPPPFCVDDAEALTGTEPAPWQVAWASAGD